MTPQSVLAKAREILTSPEAWHKGDYANPATTRYCAVGAVLKAIDPNVLQPHPDASTNDSAPDNTPDSAPDNTPDNASTSDKLYCIYGPTFDAIEASPLVRVIVGAMATVLDPTVAKEIVDNDLPITTEALINRVAAFNDDPTTTHAEIIDLFDATLAQPLP